MKHNFVRVAAASPQLKVADAMFNAASIIETIEKQAKAGVEILVFPELSLCGYTCGDLLLQSALTNACLSALSEIAKATAEKCMLVFVGLPVVFRGKLYNCAAGIANGRVLGIVPKTHLPNYGEFYEQRHFSPAPEGSFALPLANGSSVPFTKNILFRDSRTGICVGCEICEDLWVGNPPSTAHAQAGAHVIVNLSASNEIVGKREYRKTLLAAQSGRNVCAYVYADANVGESTSDAVFAGNHLVYENGSLVAEAAPFSGEIAVAEIDAGFLMNERKRMNTFKADTREGYAVEECSFVGESGLALRKISRTPFVPEEAGKLCERAELILTMQANALARRLAHTNAKTAVIGVSGGLDSALALLVTARAFDLLKKPRTEIVAVTMPGFGTTGKTKNNSLLLMKELGVTEKTVSIAKAVTQHFEDIGHDKNVFDATYENAQARYRTMILMDLANQTGGLVVGTGDLSELALGWCTYNGDHMSMYAVNSSVPKTLVKHLVRYEGERLGGNLQTVLESILGTEISPELLPPDKSGNIAQKTEDLVGPYELHDFFLYRILRCGDEPKKVFAVAKHAFKGAYEERVIKKWLVSFYKRFFSQQFKRDCVPDGVKVGSVSLSPRADWRMPSDASCALWLKQAEEL